MKVFLDECVDRRFVYELEPLEVRTVFQMGWAGVKNGELLKLAQQEFDIFVTVDRNLSFQQNITKYEIAVIILEAQSNRLADLKLLVPRLLSVISSACKGEVTRIGV
jgi:Domain of unknown function (DUF5615)